MRKSRKSFIILTCMMLLAGVFTLSAPAKAAMEIYVNSWNSLCQALSNTSYRNATVFLTGHVTSVEEPTARLEIPSDQVITLNLNGYSIDRNLKNKYGRTKGYVIANEGTLTITGSGIITGGNNYGNGGGIYNTGTLILSGGTISTNTATLSGGRTCLQRPGTGTGDSRRDRRRRHGLCPGRRERSDGDILDHHPDGY